MKTFCLMLIACVTVILCGCSSKTVDETDNVININTCIKDNDLSVSKYGENMAYYYMNPNEISLYYTKNWKKGIISWKRYFMNAEQYNIQKSMYPNAVCKDNELTIYIKEYMVVEDMDAHWNSIENSSVYTLIK